MLERWLLVWLAASSAVAFFWPRLAPGWLDPFSKPFSAYYLPWLIVVTMFMIGWMLPRDEVRQVARRWPAVLFGTAVQYATMPALGFLAAKACGLSGDLLVGMVLVGCVPGAMASNVLTLLARGNASYSVSLTTLATLLSPIAAPAAMGLLLHSTNEIDASVLWKSCWTLLTQVVFPVVSGHLLGRAAPQWQTAAGRAASLIANVSILLIIAAVVGDNRAVLGRLPALLLLALLAVNVLGYAAGWLSGWAIRLDEPMRRALTLEIGMQNAGLGAVLAGQLFADRAEVALPPALYTFGCMLTGTMLARWWATRQTNASPAGEPASNEA